MKWKPNSLNYALNLVRQEFKGFIPEPTVKLKNTIIKLSEVKISPNRLNK